MARTIKPVGQSNTWTPWMAVNNDKRSPVGQIVYELRATCNGQPQDIQRAKDNDKNGILYIGETDVKPDSKGRSRYRTLVRSFANPKRKNKHSAAQKYFSQGYQKFYPLAGIEVRYKIVCIPHGEMMNAFTAPEGKAMATTGERSELCTYKYQFGELPPLNSIGGKRLLSGRPVAKSPKSAGKCVKLKGS